jgi:ferredoxin
MRILIDRDRCVSAGNCVLSAPRVFGQDEEDGRVWLLQPTPDDGSRDGVRSAVARCPSRAIELAE